MSLKKYLISISVTTLLAWVSWVTVLFYIEPGSGWLAQVLFQGSLFLAVLGTFSLIGFFVRTRLRPTEPVFRHISISFRQGVMLAILVVGSLVLMGAGLYSWWSATLYVLFLFILELFFLSHAKTNHPTT